ncbi:FAD-dependent monooxygenase [Streptomyces sp. CA-288835]|uniref:FAD-dependent monooxygenase n=1 Tax=Streptomyces sp. CA-288835 TaxID=3240069 RepID=UPI003D8AB7F9
MHVLVLGGGFAGSLAAAAVAPYADRITVIERDTLPEQPGPRRGVPQARHCHSFYSGGADAAEALVPGITEAWIAAGARKIRKSGDVLLLAGSGWAQPAAGRHYAIVCSRDLLDWVLQQHVSRLPGIAFRTGTQALGLTGNRRRVNGAEIRDHTTGTTETLTADLVVDATGRASGAGQWLTQLNMPAPRRQAVQWRAGYASRYFRPARAFDGQFPVVSIQPDFRRSGPLHASVLIQTEDRHWHVTLLGAFGAEPDNSYRDHQRFLEHARQLRDPLMADLIADAEPVGAVHLTRRMTWRRHSAGALREWPDGFVMLGDAAASFNPVLAQGLSVAAHSAAALQDALRSGCQPGSGRRLQRAIDRTTAKAWLVDRVLSLLYLNPAPPLAVRFLRHCAIRAFDSSHDWPQLREALADVLTCTSPLTRLMDPRAVLPALLGPRTAPLQQPPWKDIPAPRKPAVGDPKELKAPRPGHGEREDGATGRP